MQTQDGAQQQSNTDSGNVQQNAPNENNMILSGFKLPVDQ